MEALNLLDLSNKDTDQSIINRSILINILGEFYDIDMKKGRIAPG